VTLSLAFQTTAPDAGDYIYALPDDFRLFIPPGTVYVAMSIFVANQNRIGMALRYQRPPECASCRYGDMPWDRVTTRLNTMKDRDVFKQSANGLITIVPDTELRDPFNIDDAGWLYIRKLPLDSSQLRTVSVYLKVDLAAFVAWYNGPVQWDANGDPWSENNEVDPIEVCSSDNHDGCNESNCQTDGEGYWYNDAEGGDEYCHAMPPACDGDDCLTESQCLSAATDLYWYEDAIGEYKYCHEVLACQCDSTGAVVEECTPVNCITSVQCEDADFFWYEDVEDGEKACHQLRACESVDPDTEKIVCLPENCISSDQCTSSGFSWYEDAIGEYKYCHEMPACERDLVTGEAVEECSPDNCITEGQCTEANFHWYEAECHEDPEQGVCDQYNLAGCLSYADCVAVGGEWHSYSGNTINCREATSSYTPPSPSTSPSYSSNQPSSNVSSTNWFSFLIGMSSSPGPSVSCDSQHLEACDQVGCANLEDGYWWYDGSCRAGSLEVDYNHNNLIAQAPVRLGEDADDGAIAAGDGLSIVVDIPDGARSYALLVLPNDLGYYFIDDTKIINEHLVSLADGEVEVTDDLCAVLQEAPELKGEWVVAVLSVPQTAEEFNTLNDIVAYINAGGLYSFGSYSVDVHCRVESACGPGTLSACGNESDCVASGGEWHNYSGNTINCR